MTTQVYLDCKALDIAAQPFGIDHAEALLRYQREKGYNDWTLTPGKGFVEKDGTITAADKGTDRKPEGRSRA